MEYEGSCTIPSEEPCHTAARLLEDLPGSKGTVTYSIRRLLMVFFRSYPLVISFTDTFPNYLPEGFAIGRACFTLGLCSVLLSSYARFSKISRDTSNGVFVCCPYSWSWTPFDWQDWLCAKIHVTMMSGTFPFSFGKVLGRLFHNQSNL